MFSFYKLSIYIKCSKIHHCDHTSVLDIALETESNYSDVPLETDSSVDDPNYITYRIREELALQALDSDFDSIYTSDQYGD